MAIVSTFRASVFSGTNGTSYATVGTYTPAADSLLVAFVGSSAGGGPADPSGVTGHGVTFTKIGSVLVPVGTYRIGVWVAAAGATPSSVAVTATFAGTQSGADIVEYEVTGWKTSVGAVAAIVQSPTGSGTGTSASIALAAAGFAANRPLAAFYFVLDEGITARSGWTPHNSGGSGHGSPNTRTLGQHRDDAFDTAASATWTTSADWAGIAIEVMEAGAGGAGEVDAAHIASTAQLYPPTITGGGATGHGKLLAGERNRLVRG